LDDARLRQPGAGRQGKERQEDAPPHPRLSAGDEDPVEAGAPRPADVLEVIAGVVVEIANAAFHGELSLEKPVMRPADVRSVEREGRESAPVGRGTVYRVPSTQYQVRKTPGDRPGER